MRMRWLRGSSRDWRPAHARRGRSRHPLRSPVRAAEDGCASSRQRWSVEERQRQCHEAVTRREDAATRGYGVSRRLRAPETARAVGGGARMNRPTRQSCRCTRPSSSSAIIPWTRDLRGRQRQASGEEHEGRRAGNMFGFFAFARVGEADAWPAREYGALEAQPHAPRRVNVQ